MTVEDREYPLSQIKVGLDWVWACPSLHVKGAGGGGGDLMGEGFTHHYR